MTDDKTEFQTDRHIPGVPADGPARKWFYQRIMAWGSFAACAWWPIVLIFSPSLESITPYWFALFGGICAGWMGLTQWSARK